MSASARGSNFVPFARCGPSRTSASIAAAAAATADTPSITSCAGSDPPSPFKRCGKAVPSTSAPTKPERVAEVAAVPAAGGAHADRVDAGEGEAGGEAQCEQRSQPSASAPLAALATAPASAQKKNTRRGENMSEIAKNANASVPAMNPSCTAEVT